MRIEVPFKPLFTVAISGTRRRGLGYFPFDLKFLTEFHMIDSFMNYSSWYQRKKVLLVHGDAPGVDKGGEFLATRTLSNCEWEVKKERAEWNKYGKKAGPIRNRLILDKYEPDLLLAFPDDESIGTWDMISEARERKVNYKVIQL